MSTDIVIVAAARTAVGKFGGSLAKTPAPELGAVVIAEAARARQAAAATRSAKSSSARCCTAGAGQNPARQALAQERPAARRAGADHQRRLRLGPEGRDAGRAGDPRRRQRDRHRRRPGEHEPGAARAAGSRDGQRMGDWKLVDSMIIDGLWDVYNQYHMGITAENVAKKYDISREHAGRAGARHRSRRRPRRRKPASSRTRSSPFSIPQKKGDPVVFASRRVHQPQDQRRGAGRPAPGLRQGRQRDGRQRLGPERRRRRAWS